jgi:hypothetical protein
MTKVDVINVVTTIPGLPGSPSAKPDLLKSQCQPDGT